MTHREYMILMEALARHRLYKYGSAERRDIELLMEKFSRVYHLRRQSLEALADAFIDALKQCAGTRTK